MDQKPTVKEASLNQFRATIPLLILPTLHLILCFYVDFKISDDDFGSWKWFVLFLVDLPFSIILSRLSFLGAFVAFATLGTLWWYFIGVFARWISGVGESIANR